jgi:hypothetical protein
MITFVFLIMNLSYRPYCTDGLNSLQTFSLISQFLTLFCGILIGYGTCYVADIDVHIDGCVRVCVYVRARKRAALRAEIYMCVGTDS